MSMGRVNCHTHAARPAVADFVLDPAFANIILLRARPAPRRRAGLELPLGPHTHTAPRSSQQRTLVSRCEAHPAAGNKRRGDRRTHGDTLRMDGNGETFFHDGETCA